MHIECRHGSKPAAPGCRRLAHHPPAARNDVLSSGLLSDCLRSQTRMPAHDPLTDSTPGVRLIRSTWIAGTPIALCLTAPWLPPRALLCASPAIP